jgi:hypothetical protein
MFAGQRNVVPFFTVFIIEDSLTNLSGLPFTVFHVLYFRLLPRQLNQISAEAEFFVFMGS